MTTTKRLLLACAAVAGGEFAAARVPMFAEAWPILAALALLVALGGHAGGFRLWPWLALALVGATLFLSASCEQERVYRKAPWLREARRRASAEPTMPALAATRRDFARRVSLGLESRREVVRLNQAILLGARTALPRDLRQTFIGAGTIHVFAISGLHVMAVARVLVFLLRLLWLPRRLAEAAAVPVLWGYLALIGFPPSAVRAGAMATLTCLAPLFRRRPNGLVAWSLTFLAVYLVRPTMIADVGCGLSFAVMLAILVVGERLRERPEGWAKTVAIAVAAWAAGVPIAAHVFGRVTPGGVLANLALVPAAGLTVYAGALGLLSSFVSESVAAHLNNLSALFTQAMVVLSEGVAGLPGANVEVPKWPIPTCAAWYAACALALFLLRRANRRRDTLD